MTCVFCEIVAGRAPATVVEKWPGAIAIAPLGPVTPGHTLIVPKPHVRDAAEDPWTTAKVMYQAAKFAGRFESFNIITSAGAAATQSVPHLHIHVVPRTEDDQLMVPWGTTFGDNPQAPHWCPAAQKLTVKLAEAMMDRDSLIDVRQRWLKAADRMDHSREQRSDEFTDIGHAGLFAQSTAMRGCAEDLRVILDAGQEDDD